MKWIKRTVYLLGSLILIICITALTAFWMEDNDLSYLDNSDETQSYLIKNAHVIPMNTDTTLEHVDLRILDGIIIEIGVDLSADGLTVIDAEDQYIMPGLIDMHVHVWDRFELGLYLANGVTTVRNLWGHPMHLRMKEDIVNGEIIGPNLFTSTPKLGGSYYETLDNKPIDNPLQVASLLEDYKERGYDLVKTYYGMSDSVFGAVVRESSRLHLDIAAHPCGIVPYADHFQPPVVSVEHAEDIVQQALEYQLDSARFLREVLPLFANHPEIGLCPTNTVYYNIHRLIDEADVLHHPEMGALNPMIQRTDSEAQWERWQNSKAQDSTVGEYILKQHRFQLYTVNAIHQAGGTIICGTDAGIGITPPGYAIHDELAFYLEAGLSPYEVLRTATVNAANTHEFMQHLGSVEVGKQADLLLLTNDPRQQLSTLQKPEWIMVDGRLLQAERLDQMEDKALNRSNTVATLFRYLENLLKERW